MYIWRYIRKKPASRDMSPLKEQIVEMQQAWGGSSASLLIPVATRSAQWLPFLLHIAPSRSTVIRSSSFIQRRTLPFGTGAEGRAPDWLTVLACGGVGGVRGTGIGSPWGRAASFAFASVCMSSIPTAVPGYRPRSQGPRGSFYKNGPRQTSTSGELGHHKNIRKNIFQREPKISSAR